MKTKGNDLILVGNGPSVLEKKSGEKIDSFTNIVRFNGFNLTGYEQYVGKRTTIWSRWYALPTMRLNNELESIWINMPISDRTEERINIAMDLLGDYKKIAVIIPSTEIVIKIQMELFGSLDAQNWPSSGLLAILHSIKSGFDVTIVGIDSWNKEPYHYYEKHDRKNSHHIAEVEKQYILNLARMGHLKILR